MDERLYERMNWPRIEALVYSEEDEPQELLGAHKEQDGILVQAFLPGASRVTLLAGPKDREYPMELADEAGFFAVLLPGGKIPAYRLRAEWEDGSVEELEDPYRFDPKVWTPKDLEKFAAGIHYTVYEKLGAHPMTLEGIEGTYFAVWAPNACRVSVVGDFNRWDGRRCPMRRIGESGIFELFMPGIVTGTCYKYELKTRSGLPMLKADPYACAAQLRPNTASVTADLTQFSWTDEAWLAKRKVWDSQHAPMNIYEVHLGTWRKPGEDSEEEFLNYRDLAVSLAAYVKDMGYTHIELLPVMEHPLDESWGYQTTGYYAPTARFGEPADFQYLMNYMHEQGIGVILDWVPSQFPQDAHGLIGFDGTCLYEHLDPRQGINPRQGTRLYNYGRPEVKNFLIANALFWTKVYHADGLRIGSLDAMLYLDYDRQPGEWIPNIYGGNENLEAVEFLKHLNSIFRKNGDGALLIAEEPGAWPKLTVPVEEDGLGFDYKWNTGWTSDFLEYMHYDPVFRAYHHNELTLSLIYAYSENYVLGFGHDEASRGEGALLNRMPGDLDSQLSNLRAFYGWMAAHPGKKLHFMGQEFADDSLQNGTAGLDWDQLQSQDHSNVQTYVRALNHFVLEHPALYEMDGDPEGFTWINNISANENMLVFTRQSKTTPEQLLVVLNFSPLVYTKHKIGVPFEGDYKEIFNSDQESFGGSDARNPRKKHSKKSECDGREDSIEITVPPMGIAIFSCTPNLQSEPKAAKKTTEVKTKAKPAVKKTAAKTKAKPAAKSAEKTTVQKSAAKTTETAKKTTA